MFELSGFANTASGTKMGSMDALRQANETSWFNDGDNIWIKLVANAPVDFLLEEIQTMVAISQ